MDSDEDSKMDMETEANETATSSDTKPKTKSKKREKPLKPGIIFMSTVPYRMTAKRVREIFSQYGEIGRIFLQPEIRTLASGKKEKRFVEGWIEFNDRKLAKRVAVSLNNTMVGGRKRSKAYESLWNLKYLSRFKWVHLNEQLAYERAVHQQRMRTEIAQAKREANCFMDQVEKGRELKRLEETVLKKGGLWEKYQRQVEQKKSISDKKKRNLGTTSQSDILLNEMIFAKGDS